MHIKQYFFFLKPNQPWPRGSSSPPPSQGPHCVHLQVRLQPTFLELPRCFKTVCCRRKWMLWMLSWQSFYGYRVPEGQRWVKQNAQEQMWCAHLFSQRLRGRGKMIDYHTFQDKPKTGPDHTPKPLFTYLFIYLSTCLSCMVFACVHKWRPSASIVISSFVLCLLFLLQL